MKINSVQQQNFKGKILDNAGKFIINHPVETAALAGSSVIAQKIVMSGSEAVIGPVIDLGIGQAITKATKEKDGRTKQSSKIQAIRTFSQSVGGTIVGVVIRAACIGAMTFGCMKAGSKAGEALANVLNPEKLSDTAQKYQYAEKMSAWGKALGGGLATMVMMVTNFIVDAPFINYINKSVTNICSKKPNAQVNQNKENNAKEAK